MDVVKIEKSLDRGDVGLVNVLAYDLMAQDEALDMGQALEKVFDEHPGWRARYEAAVQERARRHAEIEKPASTPEPIKKKTEPITLYEKVEKAAAIEPTATPTEQLSDFIEREIMPGVEVLKKRGVSHEQAVSQVMSNPRRYAEYKRLAEIRTRRPGPSED